MKTANKAWLDTLLDLISTEENILSIKGALSDTYTACEILNHTLVMDMNHPQVTIKARDLDLEYAEIEARMIIEGSNDLNFRPIINRTLGKWSEDKIFVRSAYGPKFVDQLPYVLSEFKRDINTRRAVISIWRESPALSLDTTCLVSLQYLVREGYLICIANMRSSDAYLGLPNDIAVFSYVAETVRNCLNDYLKINLQLGALYCNAGSRHIYAKDLEKVKYILDNPK